MVNAVGELLRSWREMLEAVLPLGPKIRRLYAVTLTSPVFIDAG
jgi:hypothetical protein